MGDQAPQEDVPGREHTTAEEAPSTKAPEPSLLGKACWGFSLGLSASFVIFTLANDEDVAPYVCAGLAVVLAVLGNGAITYGKLWGGELTWPHVPYREMSKNGRDLFRFSATMCCAAFGLLTGAIVSLVIVGTLRTSTVLHL